MYYGLLFAREFFGSPIDGAALSALAPARLKRVMAHPFLNSGKVLQGGLPASGPGGLLQRFMLNDSWALAIKTYLSRH